MSGACLMGLGMSKSKSSEYPAFLGVHPLGGTIFARPTWANRLSIDSMYASQDPLTSRRVGWNTGTS